MLLFCLDQVALIFLSRLVRECLGEWSALSQWKETQLKEKLLCYVPALCCQEDAPWKASTLA